MFKAVWGVGVNFTIMLIVFDLRFGQLSGLYQANL